MSDSNERKESMRESGIQLQLLQLFPSGHIRFAVYILFTLFCILLGTITGALLKAVIRGGNLDLFGERIRVQMSSESERSGVRFSADGVLDIGDARIQFGSFKTKAAGEDDPWSRVEFKAPFNDNNVSISVATSKEPSYFYSFQVKDLNRSGFSVSFAITENDAVYRHFRQPLSQSEIQSVKSPLTLRNDKWPTAAASLHDLECNYIAIGKKP